MCECTYTGSPEMGKNPKFSVREPSGLGSWTFFTFGFRLVLGKTWVLLQFILAGFRFFAVFNRVLRLCLGFPTSPCIAATLEDPGMTVFLCTTFSFTCCLYTRTSTHTMAQCQHLNWVQPTANTRQAYFVTVVTMETIEAWLLVERLYQQEGSYTSLRLFFFIQQGLSGVWASLVFFLPVQHCDRDKLLKLVDILCSICCLFNELPVMVESIILCRQVYVVWISLYMRSVDTMALASCRPWNAMMSVQISGRQLLQWTVLVVLSVLVSSTTTSMP